MAKAKTEATADIQVDISPEVKAELEKLAAEAAELSERTAEQAQELAAAKAENEALKSELDKAHARTAELEKLLEAGLAPGGVSDGETLTPEAEAAFTTGSEAPAADADVVAIKSKHGHAFFRAGYHVQPDWTFINRADFEPADFERLISDRMVVVREALPKAAA